MFSYRKERANRGTGAHRIATYLRANNWDIEVLDFCIEFTLEELKEYVKSRVNNNTKFFGFSVFINWWPAETNQFTLWLKTTYPDIPIILGGQGCLITPSENIDYYVDSFGEVAMVELCKYLFGNTVFHSGLKFDEHEGKKVLRALHQFPAWNLPSFRNTHQKRDFIEPFEMLTIETSRGCKFKCDFCNFPILGVKEDTSRSAQDLQEELTYNYNEWGVRNYTIADETFNDREEKIIKYSDMIENLDFQPWFMAFMRADLLIKQKPLWERMKRMGLGGHFYGIETFNHASGKIIGKGMNPDKLKNGLLEIRKSFEETKTYRGTISFICGLPKETAATFNDSIDWCVNNWQGQSVTGWYLEVPEYHEQMTNLSEFSKNLEKYGLRRRTITSKSEQLSFFPGLENLTIWEHDDMDQPEAEKLMANFYDVIKPRNFTSSGFIAGHGLIQYNTSEIKDILSIPYYDDMSPNLEQFIKRYKERKLSWKND